MLLQIYDRVLKLITYFSKKLTSAECSYIIYNEKLLAIIKSFIWHLDLASAAGQVKVYID